MSRNRNHFSVFRSMLVFLLAFIVLTGCAGNTPTPTATATVVPPTATATLLPPTATPQPTATTAPTATRQPPTATATPTLPPTPTATLMPEKLSAWCLPTGNPKPATVTAEKPAKATAATVEKDGIRLMVPAVLCTFVYTFNQPIQAGTELQVFDLTKSPWMKVALQPDAANPRQAVIAMTHTFIIDPPYWEISHRFVVKGPDGTEKRTDTVTIAKPLPKRCWDKSLPNPVSLVCPNIDGDWHVDLPEGWVP
ncbi:MAG TPA: hypothetical protein VIO61_03830 [Anaerolineaceae bacterium]